MISRPLPAYRTFGRKISRCSARGANRPGDEPFCYTVVGPGTGLGAAALLGQRDRAGGRERGRARRLCSRIPLQTASWAPYGSAGGACPQAARIGPGLENLYSSLCELQGSLPTRSAASIVASAQDPADPLATETVILFAPPRTICRRLCPRRGRPTGPVSCGRRGPD